MCGRIFRDREKLSPRYIPPSLPHREKQINFLLDFFRENLVNPSKAYLKVLQIVGPAGSGKTCSVLKFAELAETLNFRRNLVHSYINLKIQGGSKVVLYRNLLEKCAPEAYSSSLSAEEILRTMIKAMYEKEKYAIISLDEIDYFIRSSKDTNIIYDLTRLNEIEPGRHCNVVGVIFIARGRDFYERLDDAEKSTLGRIPLEFPPYRESEVYDILFERVREAFLPNTVPEDVIEYVSNLTASPPVNGDIRYALDLMYYAGNLAENLNADKVLPDHVRKVHGELHPSITEEDIINLPKKEHLITLLAVARSLKNSRKPYVTLRDIRLNYEIVCRDMDIKPSKDMEDYLQDLHDRKIIEIRSLREIGVSGTSSENLELFLENLLKRLEKELNEKR